MTPLTSRPWTGAGLIVLASWVVGVTTASMTFAQTAPRFSWQGVPLEAAIEEFVAETDIDLGYDPALVSGKKAYCETWNKSPEIVLRCLLHGTGLFFQRLPTGTYVLTSSSRAPDAWGMLEGRVVDVPDAEADAYFASRPPGAKIGAAASPQSQVIPDRAWLERRVRELWERYPDGDVPRPPHWGGYRVVPEVVEFWQGRENRLHDRFRYRRDGAGWRVDRLAP